MKDNLLIRAVPISGQGQSNLSIRCTIAVSVTALALSACAGIDWRGGEADTQSAPAVEWIDGQSAEFHVLAGELAAKRGQVEQSAKHYLEATRQSGDAAIAARATRLALYAEQEDLALQTANAWLELVPEETSAREIAARLALRAGDEAQVLQHLRAIAQMHSEGIDEGLRKVGSLLKQDEEQSELAMNVMQTLAAENPDAAGSHYGVAALATRSGDLDLAKTSIAKALKLRPDWADARLLQVGVLLKSGDIEAADQSMSEILLKPGTTVKHRLAYARLLLDADQIELARAQFLTVLGEQPRNTTALFALGVIDLDAQELDSAHDYFHRLYRTGIRTEDSAYYLGRIEEQRKNYAEAQEWYAGVTSGGRAYDAAIRRAYVISKQGKLDSAVSFLEKLRAGNPQLAIRLYSAEADILYEAKAYDRAMALYDEALAAYPDDANLLYGRALVAEGLEDFEQARSDLTRIIENDPSDARALNALGYILSNHTVEYDQALAYVQEALRITPQDAAVIDSMGWIQFRMGNLDAALEYLTLAFSKLPDPEIAAHLGEVLWVTGEQERAQKIWNQALGENPDHPVLNDTVNRLAK